MERAFINALITSATVGGAVYYALMPSPVTAAVLAGCATFNALFTIKCIVRNV